MRDRPPGRESRRGATTAELGRADGWPAVTCGWGRSSSGDRPRGSRGRESLPNRTRAWEAVVGDARPICGHSMAHLWYRSEQGEWKAGELPAGRVALGRGPGRLAVRLSEAAPVLGPCLSPVSTASLNGLAWVLLTGPTEGVRVNGSALPSGIRVLRDRDEIRLAGGVRLYLSLEELARVMPFAGTEPPVYCPRCKLELKKGEASVRCPNPTCRITHHQSAELPCWTYTGGCTLCGHPTDLEAGFRWTPEDL